MAEVPTPAITEWYKLSSYLPQLFIASAPIGQSSSRFLVAMFPTTTLEVWKV